VRAHLLAHRRLVKESEVRKTISVDSGGPWTIPREEYAGRRCGFNEGYKRPQAMLARWLVTTIDRRVDDVDRKRSWNDDLGDLIG